MDDTKEDANTDRELWREREGDYYADSVFVTKDGRIGMNAGGRVTIMSVHDWVNGHVRERLALWAAWRELNEIRARDGIPWTHQFIKASVDEAYFSQVVDELAALLGSDAKPWPPKRCLDQDGTLPFTTTKWFTKDTP